MPQFIHQDLRLLNPTFDSQLVDILTELEYLRRLRIEGSTPEPVFIQLKAIFHMLESFGSARIEGNHTTLADYVESRIEGKTDASDLLREIANLEEAMDYIELVIAQGTSISEHFIRELHAMTVSNLVPAKETARPAHIAPEAYASHNRLLPPETTQVPSYMSELVNFINDTAPPKYDLMKVALAHHRFGWIHPFGNGNGRVVRLLTYALLLKYGFNVQVGERVLNPTAVFCNDRERYYNMLSEADTGTAQGLEAWCIYVLQGIVQEVRQVDRLTDFAYLQQRILNPAIDHARERQLITQTEAVILTRAIRAGTVKAADLADTMPGLNANQRTYQIRRLVERGMLMPVQPGARMAPPPSQTLF